MAASQSCSQHSQAHKLLANAVMPVVDLLNDRGLSHKPSLVRLGCYWKLVNDLRILVWRGNPHTCAGAIGRANPAHPVAKVEVEACVSTLAETGAHASQSIPRSLSPMASHLSQDR